MAWVDIANGESGLSVRTKLNAQGANPNITGKYFVNGVQVLYVPSIVANSIFLGDGGSALIATGDGNTAVGFSTLNANQNGFFNVAVGYRALMGNVTGGNNMAIGNTAMLANISGSRNAGIGAASLSTLTSGLSNTGIGFAAIVSATITSNNTGIGAQSLSALTTGSANTAIGFNCGGGLSTGSNNTLIGANITVSGTLANTVVLADGAGNQRVVIDSSGRTSFAFSISKKAYTVATLPTPVTGDEARVTDALTPVFGSAVVGGGSVNVPVFYNGTSWIVG